MDGTNGQWVIREVIGGTDTLRASVAGTIVKGTLYDVEVQVSGNLATLKVGGVVKTSYTFDGIQGGKVGLRIAQAHTHFKEMYLRTFVQVTKYYAFGGQRIAMRRDGGLFFLAADHLGTVSMVLDAAGSKVDESRHYPYGTERWALDGTFPTDYRFTGQLLDGSINLYFMGARQYSPALGRWISPDTIVPDSRNPASLNRYSYAYNGPLVFTDPSGHAPSDGCEYEGCLSDPDTWGLGFMAYLYENTDFGDPYDNPAGQLIARMFEFILPFGIEDRASINEIVTEAIAGAQSLKKQTTHGNGWYPIESDAELLVVSGAFIVAAESEAGDLLDGSGSRGTGGIPNRQRLGPDEAAVGPHTTFRRDARTGEINHYATYQPNPRSPSGFVEELRVDMTGRGHYNKVTGEFVEPPHLHSRSVPGGVARAEPWRWTLRR